MDPNVDPGMTRLAALIHGADGQFLPHTYGGSVCQAYKRVHIPTHLLFIAIWVLSSWYILDLMTSISVSWLCTNTTKRVSKCFACSVRAALIHIPLLPVQQWIVADNSIAMGRYGMPASLTRLTLMFALGTASNLRFKLAADLVQQLGQSTAWLWPWRHSSMRIVHVVFLASFAGPCDMLRRRCAPRRRPDEDGGRAPQLQGLCFPGGELYMAVVLGRVVL